MDRGITQIKLCQCGHPAEKSQKCAGQATDHPRIDCHPQKKPHLPGCIHRKSPGIGHLPFDDHLTVYCEQDSAEDVEITH